MKYLSLIFLLFALNIYAQRSASDFAVQLSVEEINSDPYQIQLNWQHDSLAYYYTIFRKSVNDSAFVSIAEPDENIDSYVDINVTKGNLYEYKVEKYGRWFHTDKRRDTIYRGYGYILAGHEVKVKRTHQHILVVVDDLIYPQIQAELEVYRKDLIAEGWKLSMIDFPRVVDHDKLKVKELKARIQEFYSNNPDLSTLFFVGRVPIAFSGLYTPDGHADESAGAWPADGFYADMDGVWTDDSLITIQAERDWHFNRPNDGKFDNIKIPTQTELQIGRLDMYGMSNFDKSEVELIKNYFKKNHSYRKGEFDNPRRAIIDDLWEFTHDEMFASQPWMNYSALFGRDSVKSLRIIDYLKYHKYTFSSAQAMGAIDNIFDRAYSEEYAAQDQNGIMGNYFGSRAIDWFAENNIMRSALASEPSFLISFWGCRPYWILHHMGMGYTIGYSQWITQNNEGVYANNGKEKHFRQVHITLMGDPTLRLFPKKSPENVIASYDPNGTNGNVTITWDAREGEKYSIYHSKELDGEFVKVANELEGVNEFIHTNYDEDKGYYFIRSTSLEKVNSGSYFNESAGTWAQLVLSVEEEEQRAKNEEQRIEVYDLLGNLILSISNDQFPMTNETTQLRNYATTLLKQLPPGVYIIRTDNSVEKIIKY